MVGCSTSLRLFSLAVRPGQLLMAARMAPGAGDEKNTCADLYSGCPWKSSISRETLSFEGVMKYTPDRFGSVSRLTATFSTTAQKLERVKDQTAWHF